MIYNNIFCNKRVLITGNTGFKGSWLSTWLLRLGADVYGYSLNIPSTPSMFETLKLENKIHHKFGDIRDKEQLNTYIQDIKPDFIFHLAAQAIVSTSYKNPFDTITTNVVGTAAVLDALRNIDWPCTAVLITSDKAYDNVEWIWGYRENDAMGGKDVYSGSKGAAELTIKCYFHSFLKNKANLKLGVARAGNVIGGGDWSADRIVVDTIKAFSQGKPVEIRSPKATRPWQHVLEPLSGYLRLAQMLTEGHVNSGEAFNFGPRAEQTKTVLQLVTDLASLWHMTPEQAVKVTDQIPFEEAKLLKLNCDKALAYLQWHSTCSYNETVRMIVDWYSAYYNGDKEQMFELTNHQIAHYEQCAKDIQLAWTL
ncbi:MAG: CDP-glucose 4,6-dehydratase [Bacteroidales bacterium]|nr:CDP-glucose 4,6-dehydratase [Bacteroidales bacterium]